MSELEGSDRPKQETVDPSGRRAFLMGLGGLAAALGSGNSGCNRGDADGVPIFTSGGGTFGSDRRGESSHIRDSATLFQKNLPYPAQMANGDDTLYPNRLGSYTKALPHNSLGVVDSVAYAQMLAALQSGAFADFELVTLGGTQRQGNPLGAFAFALEGPDSAHVTSTPAPAFNSSWRAGEMAEVYWQALTRDVPFADYGTDPVVAAAVADLNTYSEFVAANGTTTAANLFRGPTAGDQVGPYVSQFLYKNVPFGPATLTQPIPVPAAGTDKLTVYATFLANQNGAANDTPVTLDPTPRYLRNNRDLAEWVHRDFAFQAGMYAALILNGFGAGALKAGHPYKTATRHNGFVTYGIMHVLDAVARVADLSLRACWFQKWQVHRTLRPEEYAGHLHNHLNGLAAYPFHAEILDPSKLAPGGLLQRVEAHNLAVGGSTNSYLVSMSYPEGCPPFSAYPSGHATFAGACVTALKYFFDESFVIPSPVEPNAAGTALDPYVGPPLTIGGELNKLAFNIGMGRCAAGIHWRTDIEEGNRLGEEIAIGVLRDNRGCLMEPGAMTLTKIDGTTVTI